jgi:hypothetical protein
MRLRTMETKFIEKKINIHTKTNHIAFSSRQKLVAIESKEDTKISVVAPLCIHCPTTVL